MKTSIFIRKKLYGENSLEELAKTLEKDGEVTLYEFPEFSNSLRGILRNIKFARKFKGDVNHVFQSSGAYISLFVPNTVVTYHDLFTAFAGKRGIGRILTKILHVTIPAIFAKKLICISEQTRNELISYSKLARRKSIVIYNGRNLISGCAERYFNFNCPTILHIGTAPRKNLKGLIQAVEGLKIHLDIVGKLNDEYISALQKYKIDYSNYVEVSSEKIVELYKTSDIVSFPTFAEGFGLIIIEANQIGKPVISSDIPVIHEVANDACHFVNPNDIQEIKDGILKIWHDEYYRCRLIELGYKNAERFTLDKMRKNYYNLYEDVYKK